MFRYRWRKKWNIEGVNGDGQTSVDPVQAMHSGYESLLKAHTAAIIVGCNPASMIGNTDQTMIFIDRSNTTKAYAARRAGSKAGRRKRANERDTFTVCLSNRGPLITSAYVVLVSNTKDQTCFSSDAVQKLAEIGLKPGNNTLSNGVRLFVACSNNGWMQKYHMNSMATTQRSASWTILTSDNWHYFDSTFTNKLLQMNNIHVLTPPGLSHIYNFLDQNLNGTVKNNQSADRDADRSNPALREIFLTSTGKLKAGNQFRTLFNVKKRLETYYNKNCFKNGYLRDMARTGYGLPADGSMDKFFLSNAFGYNIGDRKSKSLMRSMGIGGVKTLDPFKATESGQAKMDIVNATMRGGWKRTLAGENNTSKRTMKKMKQLIDTEIENNDNTAEDDQRVMFIETLRAESRRFSVHLKNKFRIASAADFHLQPIAKQRAVMHVLLTSEEWKNFRPGWIQIKSTESSEHMEGARRAIESLENNSVLTDELIDEMRETILNEAAERQEKQQQTLAEGRIKSLKVADLRKLLTDNGLDDKGRKRDLVDRAIRAGLSATPAQGEEKTDAEGKLQNDGVGGDDLNPERLRASQLRRRLRLTGQPIDGRKVRCTYAYTHSK